MHSSTTQDLAIEREKIRLFNKRMVLAVINECNRLRELSPSTAELYSYMKSNSVPAQLIAYLESSEANALPSANDIMQNLKRLTFVLPANQQVNPANQLFTYLEAPIQADTLGLARYENFAIQAGMTVKSATSSSTSSASTKTASHQFSDFSDNEKMGVLVQEVDSNAIATRVLAGMAAQHSSVSVRDPYAKETYLQTFFKEMKDKDPETRRISYCQLMAAVSRVQDYFNVASTIPKTNTSDLTALRDKLDADLKELGTIGKFFNNPMVIGGKEDESTSSFKAILKSKVYETTLGTADIDAIRGVFEYSKHVNLEMHCKALRDPHVGLQLQVIDRDIQKKDYKSLETRHTDENLKKTLDKLKTLEEFDQYPDDHYKQIFQNLKQKIEPTYFAAVIDAGIQLTYETENKVVDLSRVLQNSLTSKNRNALIPCVKKYFVANNLSSDDAKITSQLDNCLEFFQNYVKYVQKLLRSDSTFISLCNNLKSNFTESNYCIAMGHLQGIVRRELKEFDAFFDKMIAESKSQIRNQTYLMKQTGDTATRPADWFKQGMLLSIGQGMTEVYGSKMHLQLPHDDRIMNILFNNFYETCLSYRELPTTIIPALTEASTQDVTTTILVKKQPSGLVSKYVEAGVNSDTADKTFTSMYQTAQTTPLGQALQAAKTAKEALAPAQAAELAAEAAAKTAQTTDAVQKATEAAQKAVQITAQQAKIAQTAAQAAQAAAQTAQKEQAVKAATEAVEAATAVALIAQKAQSTVTLKATSAAPSSQAQVNAAIQAKAVLLPPPSRSAPPPPTRAAPAAPPPRPAAMTPGAPSKIIKPGSSQQSQPSSLQHSLIGSPPSKPQPIISPSSAPSTTTNKPGGGQ